jgi:hypothetical protein
VHGLDQLGAELIARGFARDDADAQGTVPRRDVSG